MQKINFPHRGITAEELAYLTRHKAAFRLCLKGGDIKRAHKTLQKMGYNVTKQTVSYWLRTPNAKGKYHDILFAEMQKIVAERKGEIQTTLAAVAA